MKHNDLVMPNDVEDAIVKTSNVLAPYTLLLGFLSQERKFGNLLQASFDGVSKITSDRGSMLSQIFHTIAKFRAPPWRYNAPSCVE
jgi:hypothetical protein